MRAAPPRPRFRTKAHTTNSQVAPARARGAPAALARAASTALCVLLAPACALPRDADGTLDRVRGGTLRVGVEDAPPWVVAPAAGAALAGAAPRGVEPTLVEGLARELGARIDWRRGTEAELLESVHRRELDLVAGGFTADSPWKGTVALTKPFAEDDAGRAHVLAAPPGENAWLVRVERHLRARGLGSGAAARARPAGVSR